LPLKPKEKKRGVRAEKLKIFFEAERQETGGRRRRDFILVIEF